MASNREIAVTISAYDQFTATMEKFKESVGQASDHAVGKASEMESRWGKATDALKEKWLELAGAYLSVEFLLDARRDALEAESSMNKLRMSVENLGLSWKDQGGAVNHALEKTAEYAITTVPDASKSLQTLIFHSGKYQESMENLNLVYDLAYMKGIDQHEAAMMVGKAMTGNVTMLGRYIPELHDLKNTLGDNATQAEKSAYALALLKEKTQDAYERMTEHERRAREAAKAMEEFKEAVGKAVLYIQDYALAGFNSLAAAFLYVAGYAAKAMGFLQELTARTAEAKKMAEDTKAWGDAALQAADHIGMQAGRLTGLTSATEAHTKALERHGQTAAQLAATIKAKHDAEDAATKAEQEKEAADIKAYNLSVDMEKKIHDVIRATAKLGASKEELIQIEAKEFAYNGATIEQVERYTAALKLQSQKEDERTTIIEKARAIKEAEKKLEQLDEKNPYSAKVAMAEAARKNEIVRAQQTYQTKLQQLKDYNAQVLDNMKATGASQDDMERKQKELDIGYAKATRDAKLGYAADAFGAASNLMQNLYTLTGSHNKQMFEAMKAFAVAQTIIDTYRGAQAAYTALSGIPVVGPELGVAAAAAAIVAGMVRVQQIQAQHPGGGSSISAGGTANPSYSGGSPSAYPVPQTIANQQTGAPTHVTIVVNNPLSTQNWDAITQNEIVPALNRAGDRNIQLNGNVIMNTGY